MPLKTLANAAKNKVRDYLDDFDYLAKMGSIGTYGDIIFKISSIDLISPESYDVAISSKVKKHQIINNPDITEFQGRNLRKISLPIKLVGTLTNINKSISTLTNYTEEGIDKPFIFGGEKIGDNNYRIENFNYTVAKTDVFGAPLVVNANLSLEEYIDEIVPKKEKEIQKKGVNSLQKDVITSLNKVAINNLKGGRLW